MPTTSSLRPLSDLSTRIRELDAAAYALEGLARIATDDLVRSILRQTARSCIESSHEWLRRLDADMIATVPSAEDPSTKAK